MAERLLRACLAGLVLVDLWFVHLTGAARPEWLALLCALTLGAPLWARWRPRFAYRALWNAGVLGVFTLLLHHATGYDLRYVLEDGLILAALCQVHLLNNLSERQRPDLLFLDSFLIAIVAGYLCSGMAFALAFGLYAPLLIAGLCLHGLARSGAELAPRAARAVLADGGWRSAALLALTLAAFVLCPRDFERQGLIAAHLDFTTGSGTEVGFAETLSLARRGPVAESDAVVFRARLERGSAADVPSLWRGATLLSTDGDHWWPFADGDLGGGFAADPPWRGARGELLRGPGAGLGAELAVEGPAGELRRLFAPLSAERLRCEGGGRVLARADGTLELDGEAGASGPRSYRLALAPGRPALGGPVPAELQPGLLACLQLPDARRVRAALELAEELAAVVEGAEQHELVAHFSAELSRRCAYLPPGAEGGARSLEQFLRGAGGHCEFFASALATMLRSRGVPCRVATGYKSAEWDREQRVLTFRKRHAHAWVEVLDPQGGWYAVDPDPAPAAAGAPSLLAQLRERLAHAWSQLTGFDAERRSALLAALRALPGRGLAAAGSHPAPALGALLLLGAALGIRLARRRRGDPAVRSYERALDATGLAPLPGETPRELLERARALAAADARRLERLARATAEHERRRYAVGSGR